MCPAGARQDGSANCSLPIPAGVFNDTGNPACPSGTCSRTLSYTYQIYESCIAADSTSVEHGTTCAFNCYNGSLGETWADCNNGAWQYGFGECSKCWVTRSSALRRAHLQTQPYHAALGITVQM